MKEKNTVSQAAGKYVRIAPQKCRLVADLVRDRYVGEALTILHFSKKKASSIVEKVLRSAIASLIDNADFKAFFFAFFGKL